MDIISYNIGATANGRIESFIENPDSTSGVVTVPKVIASGETITIPTGRMAILPNVQIDGTLDVQGEVFIPSGATMTGLVEKVTSTDNAIVRFNGTTGDIQNSGVIIDDNNNIMVSGSNYPNITLTNINSSSTFPLIALQDLRTNAHSWNIEVGRSGSALSFRDNNASDGVYERMRIDSAGNVGIGVTPSAWYSGKHIQTLYSAFGESAAGHSDIQNNSYEYASNSYKYIGTGLGASRYVANFGNHLWQTAPSGTAGSNITWTNAMTLDGSGNLLLQSGTGALGYGTGAGGQVTQLTSKSTAVTLNKPCGTIVTSSSALAAGATVGFYMYNTLAAYFNMCVIETSSGNYNVSSVTENGDVYIKLTNTTGTALSESIGIRFALIKGANS